MAIVKNPAPRGALFNLARGIFIRTNYLPLLAVFVVTVIGLGASISGALTTSVMPGARCCRVRPFAVAVPTTVMVLVLPVWALSLAVSLNAASPTPRARLVEVALMRSEER